MKIVERGVLTESKSDTSRAVHTFPGITVLSNGVILATVRVGSTKDSPDERIELYRSLDNGKTWSEGKRLFEKTKVNGIEGSIKICYLTEINPGHIIAACMWVDRQTYPGKPLFNTETEGCLPMAILLSDSYDNGKTWTPLREVPMPDEIGPPSLTSPILKLKNGTLAMSIETNKNYKDKSKWNQRVVLFHSKDEGKTWEKPITVWEDKSGRTFYWDLRTGIAPDGRLVAFAWTYDSESKQYLNIRRRISNDNGLTWLQPEDIGFADQPSHPAILSDGRVTLSWVDRFGSRTIKARMAQAIDQPFDENTEITLYSNQTEKKNTTDTGELLGEMSLWNFGLPFCEALPNNDVIVMYYAGTDKIMDIYWVILSLNK